MKRILVPTDFSSVADNALEYAINIGAKFKSELYLYHAYYINKVDYHLSLPEDKQPFKKKVERQMNLKKLRFMESMTQAAVSVQTFVEQKDFHTLFRTKVTKHEIDLIVMGSKGATGLKRAVFGSVAATALKWAQVPVLIIPPHFSFQPLKHIVVAVDDREITSHLLLPIEKLALAFGAKITLLNVNSNRKSPNASRIPDIQLEGVEVTYREIPKSTSVIESINQFIENENCDLLGMIRREKGFFERIFSKSMTKKQLYNNQIPLLVLPEI